VDTDLVLLIYYCILNPKRALVFGATKNLCLRQAHRASGTTWELISNVYPTVPTPKSLHFNPSCH
jgi:hypothetical protein